MHSAYGLTIIAGSFNNCLFFAHLLNTLYNIQYSGKSYRIGGGLQNPLNRVLRIYTYWSSLISSIDIDTLHNHQSQRVAHASASVLNITHG